MTVPLMVLACAGGGLLLSFGLCGAAASASGHLRALGSVGVSIFLISIAALPVGFIWLVIIVLINAFRK